MLLCRDSQRRCRRAPVGDPSRLIEFVEARVLLSVTPSLVKDINSVGLGSNPSGFANLNGVAIFAASDPVHGDELWRSDGTAAGTSLVTDLDPGTASSYPSDLISAGNLVYFAADDGTHGPGLWRTDGTAAGTTQLVSFPNATHAVSNITVAGTQVFFVSPNDLNPYDLWVTDGTPQHTLKLTSGEFPSSLVADGNSVYFVGTGGVFHSDGTPAGTTQVAAAPVDTFFADPTLAVTADRLFVITDSRTLWTSDRSGGGPATVTPPGITVSLGSLAVLGNDAYFIAGDAQHGSQLWKSDGTVAGTGPLVQVSDIFQIGSGFQPTISGNKLYFLPKGDVGGPLWESDGTAAGTVPVQSAAGSYGAARWLTDVNGTLFFAGTSADNYRGVWKSDGTSAGTVPVKDVAPPTASQSLGNFANIAGRLFFAANDGQHGNEPWISDGTAAGTAQIAQINQSTGSSAPLDGVDVNGTLFFTADDGVHGRALWKSDGTDGGTVLVKAVTPDSPPMHDSRLTAVNGLVYFSVRDATYGDELWKSDGTSQGTAMVADLAPGAASSNPSQLTPFDGKLYFLAAGQIWKTDGTSQGTVRVAALPPDGQAQLIGGGATLFLSTILHLYRVDAAGLVSVLGPRPHYYLDARANILRASAAMLGGNLYYLVEQPVNGVLKPVLYRSDGTPAGTSSVADLTSESFYAGTYLGTAGGRLFFSLSDKLWSSDGTANGTVSLGPGYLTARPAASAGTAFLTAFVDSLSANELLKSDGTPQGTSVLSTFPNAAAAYAATDLADFAGQLFFNAGGPMWQSDGTAEGTHPVPNWPADVTSSSFLTPSGGRLFFSGSDPVHGAELWNLELPGTIAGSAFVDTNHDGIRQPGEPDLAGATIYLDANGNGRLDAGEARATTDSHGNYLFFNVPAGSYAVRQVPPPGYALTSPLGYSGSVVSGDAVASGPHFGDVPIASVPMNFDYLLTLAQHYGQPGTFATGDASGDGQVNFADLLLVAQNYGHPLPDTASALLDSVSLVPSHNRPRRRA